MTEREELQALLAELRTELQKILATLKGGEAK